MRHYRFYKYKEQVNIARRFAKLAEREIARLLRKYDWMSNSEAREHVLYSVAFMLDRPDFFGL